MKEVKFTEQGPVFVETLQVSSEKFEMPDFDNILVSYKDTLIFALQKRANHCIKDLNDNSERIISTNTNSIEYSRTDKTCNSFNNNNYVAMLQAIKIIESNEFDKLNTIHWSQIVKALYWVKPINKDGFTFAQLISRVLDECILANMELARK